MKSPGPWPAWDSGVHSRANVQCSTPFCYEPLKPRCLFQLNYLNIIDWYQ